MDRTTPHYHIRWSNEALDWESFDTHVEAKVSAKQLMRFGESYTIQDFDGNCPRCLEAK